MTIAVMGRFLWNNAIRILAVLAIAAPLSGAIRVLGVATAAGFAPGMPLPGSLGSIFCTGLTGVTGVRVVFAAGDAPLLAVVDFGAYQQVNFQVPWKASGPATLIQGSERAAIPADPAPWGQFFSSPDGYVIGQHAMDYALVSAANPARPREWILIYGTNFSEFDPSWAWSVWMTVGGESFRLESNYMGLAPGVPGVYQFNLRMPEAMGSGEGRIYIEGTRFCGFFFTPGCGRGLLRLTSATARLRVQ